MDTLYKNIADRLAKADGKYEWEGYAYSRRENENEVLSFVYAVADSAPNVLETLEELDGVKFFYDGLPTKDAIKMCTLLSNTTAYAVGGTMDWEDYDESITYERTYVTPDYVNALRLLMPLLESGQALLLPKTVSDHEMFEETKTKKYVLTKDVLHTRQTQVQDTFLCNTATQYPSTILLPFPYLQGADFQTISEIRNENETYFKKFQEELLALVRRDPRDIDSLDVQYVIERLGNSIIQVCEEQKKAEVNWKKKGIEIYLLFGVAAINLVLPPPLSSIIGALGLIYNLPTIQDLKAWYESWTKRKAIAKDKAGGLEFLWLAEESEITKKALQADSKSAARF